MNRSIRVIKENLNKKEETTLLFAAEELQKYLRMIIDDEIIISDNASEALSIVTLGIGMNPAVNDVPNVELDDAIYIDVNNLCGTITGSNARSVLIAVYRFLKELGFYFIRPGKGGEKIPDHYEEKKVFVNEKASYRHRGITLEGCLFKEYIPEMIDWLPKVAMNCYFIQFKTPEFFLNRWYECHETADRPQGPLSKEETDIINEEAEKEIAKRSILFHAVGHAWTCEPLGFDVNGWDLVNEKDIPEEKRSMLAMVNGERKPFKNIAIDTNLCYSRADVRDEITDCVIRYCKKHPDVNYLHFWLADGRNNNCECGECTKKRTSDYYVQMLNELDEKLTKEGLDTRIVFLLYVDLLWKPLCEKFKNSERFTLMFAPITRSFSNAMDVHAKGKISDYKVNELNFPTKVEDNIEYLREWQTIFNGDAFDYDYYFWHDFLVEYTYQDLSKVIYKDVQNLHLLGLNGMVNPISHRTILPTAFGMQIMAEARWNKNVPYDEVKNNVFYAEYGENYLTAKKYLEELSKYNCSKALRCEEPLITEENFGKLKKGIKIIAAFKNKAEAIVQNAENGRIKHNWEGILFHADIQEKMFNVYLNIEGDYEKDITVLKEYSLANEDRFKDEFSAETLNLWIDFIVKQVLKNEQIFDIREKE